MAMIDVFNGDADGLCALVQLRLSSPANATLVTGVKRDVSLLTQVRAVRGDTITALDISLNSNREPLLTALSAGARVRWFDHHFAGNLPVHSNLETYIDASADVCTSIIVERHLGERRSLWAIVGAFGDNLGEVAVKMAGETGLSAEETGRLKVLGEVLNYNAYGESMEDLRFHPAELFHELMECENPFAFIGSTGYDELVSGYREDMAMVDGIQPVRELPGGAVFILPDTAWSRLVIGVFANELASRDRDRAHAILVRKPDGGFLVSARAPKSRPVGADELCLRFPTGGGRKAAAGINRLPEPDLELFIREFANSFGGQQGRD